MKQYIDKSALVAEIEKRKKEAESNCGGYKSYDEHRCDFCTVGFYEEFLEILDTLEVKEVDSGKEIKDILNQYYYFPEEVIDTPTIIRITAKYLNKSMIDLRNHFLKNDKT